MEQLILTLLPAIIQYGPGLVKDVVDLIHGNPQQAGESDTDYATRLNVETQKLIDAAKQQNAAVEAPEQ